MTGNMPWSAIPKVDPFFVICYIMATMKAFVYDRYGPPEVLQLREVPRPEPGDREILVKVIASMVSAEDRRREVNSNRSSTGPIRLNRSRRLTDTWSRAIRKGMW